MFFVDTNVFVYANDETDKSKTKIARELLRELSRNNNGAISTQVVQEFCNVALVKPKVRLSMSELKEILSELLLPMLAHQPDREFYIRALELFQRYSLSFYDALIVQAAIDLDCDTLYSEDLQAGASYGGVKVINPFGATKG